MEVSLVELAVVGEIRTHPSVVPSVSPELTRCLQSARFVGWKFYDQYFVSIFEEIHDVQPIVDAGDEEKRLLEGENGGRRRIPLFAVDWLLPSFR